MNINAIRQITKEAQYRQEQERVEQRRKDAEKAQEREREYLKSLKEMEQLVLGAAKAGKDSVVVSSPRQKDVACRTMNHFLGMGFQAKIESGADWEGFTSYDVRVEWKSAKPPDEYFDVP